MFLSLIAIRKRQIVEKSVIPCGMTGVWIVGLTGLSVTLFSIFLAFLPPGGTVNVFLYELKLIGGSFIFILLAMVLYYRKRLFKN